MRFPILIQQEGSSGYCIKDIRESGGEPPQPKTKVDTVEIDDVA